MPVPLFPYISDLVKARAFRLGSEADTGNCCGLTPVCAISLFLLLPLGADLVSSREEDSGEGEQAQEHQGVREEN